MRKTGDKPGADGIDSGRVNDRDRRAHFPDRKRRGRRDHDDKVYVCANDLGRKLVEALRVTLRITAFYDEIAAL